MEIQEILKQVSMAHASFFTPVGSMVPTHYNGRTFSREQINSICLVVQQTYAAIDERDLGKHDLFYLTTENYRIFFRWIEYGMLGFVFDATSSVPILMDLIHATAEKLETVYREEVTTQARQEQVRQKFEAIREIVEETVGPLGADLIEAVSKDIGFDPENPTSESIEQFAKKLEQSASMIIGPTRAAEMAQKVQDLS